MDVKFCIEIESEMQNFFWINTTHGLRMPNEAFFQQYLKLLGMGIMGIFCHFNTVSLSSMFLNNQPLFQREKKN